MHSIKVAIIKTLCYADIFDFPLTLPEIQTKLISPSPVSQSVIKTHLTHLHDSGMVCQTGSYYHLPKRAQIVKLRQLRSGIAAAKYHYAVNVANELIKRPYVMAVFLTGAVAVGNAPEQDDIDILIVTQAQKLWTCRFYVTIWLEYKHLRRRPQSTDVTDKICPNLFLTTESLMVPEKQHNLYTAHEVIQTKPLIDPHHLYDHFLSENQWLVTYLGNQQLTSLPKVNSSSKTSMTEVIIRQLQEIYMKPKQTREIVTPDVAYFHPRDTAGIVLAAYNERLNRYKITL